MILAVLVCLISSFVTTLLIQRARTTRAQMVRYGQSQRHMRWVVTAGVAAGFGIWATHFIAMMAYDPGLPATYDLRLTLLSLICAIGLTAGGIEVGVSQSFRGSSLMGGAVMGCGIACMHFLGMAALDIPGRVLWAPDLVIFSIVSGMALSAAAMWAVNQPARRIGWLAAPLLALAIICHHFVAMGAITILPDPLRIITGLRLSTGAMSLALTLTAIAVLSLCAFAVQWGQRIDAMRADSDRRFRVLLEGLEDTAIFLLDREGRVLDWNNGSDRISQYPLKEIVGKVYGDVCAVDADLPVQYREALEEARLKGRAELEGPAMRADGRHFWGHTIIRALHDDDGQFLGFANFTQEITARKAAQDRILDMSRNFDAALSHMSQGLCLFDRNEKLVLANKRFNEIYGLDPALVQPGVSFRTLLAHVLSMRDGQMPDEETLERFHARHRAVIALPGGGELVSDYFEHRIMSISHRPMPEGGWVSTFDDITERRKTEQRIAHMARHDGMTGLPNRMHFNGHLDSELGWAARHGEQVAVISVDLDRFKDINDQRGHTVGDAVLKTVSERMASGLREGEFVARFGGDEFAAIKRYQNSADLDEFLARLRQALSEPIHIAAESDMAGFEITPHGSIGAALYPQDGTLREVLLNNADLALYRAKATHGEHLCFFESGADEAARDRRALAKDLERALKNDEFRLFYQVQQSVATGDITGYEALIRWKHPLRGFVSPADFIAVAEESGAIIEIGAWVLRTACEEAVRWNNHLKVAVNLSPVQLNDDHLIEMVRAVLIETRLAPSRLELEITESTIIDDKLRALHLLRQIKALGVTIAIDDFGTGYASLDTLNAFPFDKIKIDRSFLMEADTSPQARAIVRAILALGRSLEIPVLAEGVETASQLALLREENCAEAQGYLLGRPQEIVPPSPAPQVRAAG